MEPAPETTPPTGEADARTLFAAKLAGLVVEKPEPENATAKKRGAFLTRRFFGIRDRKDAADPSPSPNGETTPSDAPAKLVGSALAVSPLPGALAYKPSPDSIPPEEKTPPSSNAAYVSGDARLLEIYPPAPPPDRPAPAPAATDLPEPRISVPPYPLPPTRMTPAPTAHSSHALGRASAQLTLGFEITSLQLTPFFRLGSVQLKSLSNVVSLGLVADGQADHPFAAGISFQIERVELGDGARLKSILLKPLGESREITAPLPRLQVDSVAITGEGNDAPISVTTSGAASTAVQLVGTFAVAAIDFSPAFEIDTLRLEPVSNTVLLRVAPSSGPDTPNLPSSFELAEVQLADDGQVRGARLVPKS